MSGFHSNASLGSIHKLHDKEYVDKETKEAAVLNANDIGKAVKDTNALSLSVILATTPLFGNIPVGREYHFETTSAAYVNQTLGTFDALAYSDQVFLMVAKVTAFEQGGGDAAAYIRTAAFKNDSGTLSAIGSVDTTFTAEDDASWDCTLVASGTDVILRVTGDGTNDVNWEGELYIMQLKDR